MNDILRKYYKSNFLMHDSGERKNHKYIAKVKTKNSDRYRYFYSQSEYDAFLQNNRDNLNEAIEQTLDDNGAITESVRLKYGEDGNTIESAKMTSFKYDSSGTAIKKREHAMKRTSDGKYASEVSVYRHRGRNFIDKILNTNNEYWEKTVTSF